MDRWGERRSRRLLDYAEMIDPVAKLRSRFHLRSRLTVNLLSEFFGTFMLLFIGTGISAQFVLKEGHLNNYFQVSLGWGLTISLCVYGIFHTSGGHMNPAVSLAFVTLGKLPIAHLFPYSLVQTLGAFLGAALCYHVNQDQFYKFAGAERSVSGLKATASIFCSFPEQHITHYTAFLDQIVGTALLMLVITLVIDKRNRVPSHMQPLLFGVAIFLICSSYGMNVGNPINPARDLGPRIFLLFAGYGWEAFSWHGYYFWIPIVAPLIGAPLGAWLYQVLVGIHIPDEVPQILESKEGINSAVGGHGESEFDPLNSAGEP